MPVNSYRPRQPDERFFGARTKLYRASRFIDEIEAEHENYLNGDHYRAEPFEHNGTLAFRVQWDFEGQWPGAVAGDCIHNLRCSLDLLASEMARIRELSDKDVYFPFGISPETLEDQIKKKKFHRAGPDAVDLIRNLAPYRGGNDALRAIHDLDIRDKHSAMMVVLGKYDFEAKAQYDVHDPLSGDFAFKPVRLEWLFPDDTPFAGREVIPTLHDLYELVHGVIEAFSRMLDARDANT